MNQTKNEIVQLKGLGCADCAARMEEAINEMNGISSASIDFVTQRLVLVLDGNVEKSQIITAAASIIHSIEPDVMMMTDSGTDLADEKEKPAAFPGNLKVEWKFALAFGLFLMPWLIHFSPTQTIVVYTAAYLIAGGSVLYRAARNLFEGRVFDEHFLMSIATLGAFAIGEYPEGVAVMLFYQVGEYFQDKAVNQSRRSIAALMDIRPLSANLIHQDWIETVNPEDVRIGDLILVKPGEKIPLDGIVLKGSSLIETSALTGESLPREAGPGSEVLGGTVNQLKALTVRVSKLYEDSTVAKILELVQSAGSRKAKTEQFMTKFALVYTPVVVGFATLLTVIPMLILPDAVLSEWVYRSLIFLVISCPCALVISIPLGFFGGIGSASKQGILIKGGNFLEALNQVDTIIFDKTGTLTKGVFHVKKIMPEPHCSEDELLEMAALAESTSTHPIAVSVQKAWKGRINGYQIESAENINGQGIRVNVNNRIILAGNHLLMKTHHIDFSPVDAPGTVIYIASDGRFEGSLLITDEMKPEIGETIRLLRKRGIKRIAMLTGDREEIAREIARDAGITEVYADLMPDDKVTVMETIMAEKTGKGRIMVVGDGINDAPILARADIGAAMGAIGSDAAIEAADIVIMNDDPAKLITALETAHRTRQIVWQNIVLAIGIKSVVMLLGVFGLATIWSAVFADVGVTILAVLNAMRLLGFQHQGR
jgi:Zn2+/Cd2+-exporting ATPase